MNVYGIDQLPAPALVWRVEEGPLPTWRARRGPIEVACHHDPADLEPGILPYTPGVLAVVDHGTNMRQSAPRFMVMASPDGQGFSVCLLSSMRKELYRAATFLGALAGAMWMAAHPSRDLQEREIALARTRLLAASTADEFTSILRESVGVAA